MKRPVKFSKILIILVLFPVPAYGNAVSDQYDISFKTGSHSGAIQQPPEQEGDDPKQFSFGGAPIAMVFNKDLSLNLSLLMEVGIVLDVSAGQVTKQGFYGGVGWHLLGGARRIAKVTKFANIIRSNPYNLSLLAMSGIQHFSASDPKETAVNVVGSNFEIVGGVQYRYDVGEQSSIGVEFMQILYTLPASVERLETTGTSLFLFWRTFV